MKMLIPIIKIIFFCAEDIATWSQNIWAYFLYRTNRVQINETFVNHYGSGLTPEMKI